MIQLVVVVAALSIAGSMQGDEAPPLSDAQRARIHETLDARLARLSEQIRANPDDVALYSDRGAAFFQLGRFDDAVVDFDKMIALDATLAASHWRRGIALYYAKRYKESAKQFESYHTIDNVDRENGIWRYLAQVKAYGAQRAREDLLKYEKDDREPFPDLYAMFAGKLEADDVLNRIESAAINGGERQKRLFYAHLYVGLYASTLDNPQAALEHLREAVANPWGQMASGGPGYMWHVARVHYDVLVAERAKGDETPRR